MGVGWFVVEGDGLVVEGGSLLCIYIAFVGDWERKWCSVFEYGVLDDLGSFGRGVTLDSCTYKHCRGCNGSAWHCRIARSIN